MEPIGGDAASVAVSTSERRYMRRAWADGAIGVDTLLAETTPPMVTGVADQPNPLLAGEPLSGHVGDPRRMVTSDEGLVRLFADRGLYPSFPAAGPRRALRFDPCTVRAAVVAVGGTAPGTNAVIHAIVRRHAEYARAAQVSGGRPPEDAADCDRVIGIRNGFEGLMGRRGGARAPGSDPLALTVGETGNLRTAGGCFLGLSRYDFASPGAVAQVADNILADGINLLYVLGGAGGMQAALRLHDALRRHPQGRGVVVAGVPKSMDNDIPWMWQSLGHATAVAEAARLLEALRLDAESNRRVILVELFGADTGFVAANAVLLSGQTDCVVIPEERCDPHKVVRYVAERARTRRSALVVLAEGSLLQIGEALQRGGLIQLNEPAAALRDPHYSRQDLRDAALRWLRDELRTEFMNPPVFTGQVSVNQPGYLIRAVPPGAEDIIRAERMGDLVVDGALAGYTGFMLSLWLGYVLVPLHLAEKVRKRILVGGMIWREVVASTGQPSLV